MLVKLINALYNDIGTGLNDATIRSRLDSIREQAEAVETEIQQAKASIKELETKLQAQQLAPHQDRLEDNEEKFLQILFRSGNGPGLREIADQLELAEGKTKYHAERLDELGLIELSGYGDLGEVYFLTPKGRKYVVENKLE